MKTTSVCCAGMEEDELCRLLCPRGRLELPREPYNEVYPGVLLGDGMTALCVGLLRRMGVTHVLNAACGRDASLCLVNTGPALYRAAGIRFLGIEALDVSVFRLDRFFDEAADFIERALAEPGGRVFVHCHQGISRSATLVLAFLMLRRRLSAREAVRLVRARREIVPNRGFLRQLCLLEHRLTQTGGHGTPANRPAAPGCGSRRCRYGGVPNEAAHKIAEHPAGSWASDPCTLRMPSLS